MMRSTCVVTGEAVPTRLFARWLMMAWLVGLSLFSLSVPQRDAQAAAFKWPWASTAEPGEPTVHRTLRVDGGMTDVAGDEAYATDTDTHASPGETASDAIAIEEESYSDAARDAVASDAVGYPPMVSAPRPDSVVAPKGATGIHVVRDRSEPLQVVERISLFASDIAVQNNGDLLVTERIRVVAAGREIKRGIVRDFPTRYRTPEGLNVKVGMAVLSVSRDGRDELYTVTRIANGVRIRMGEASTLLDPGVHDYVIRYRTSRQIGFFETFDELYWNVTGSDWTFPIDVATARITLPAQVDIQNTAVYTGVHGSRARDAQEVSRRPGEVEFRTTAGLAVGEGLTVAAAWPKGVVQPPALQQRLFYWVRDNLALGTAVLGALLLLGYYLHCAWRVRRRSHRLIVPLFEPPAGMSAAAVRFVATQRIDDQVFTVTLLELIAQQWMRMTRQADGDVAFERLSVRPGARVSEDPLLAGALDKLFSASTTFMRDEPGSDRLSKANEWVDDTLRERWSALFRRAGRPAGWGLLWWLLYAAACIAAAWTVDPANGESTLVGVIFAAPACAVLALIARSWWRRRFSMLTFPFVLFFLLPFLGGGLALLLTGTQPFLIGALPGLLPVLIVPVVVFAFQFLRGYTEAGYALKDQIDGFKQYLRVAEGPELAALTTPQERLEVFERYLPYAVALDVGRDWSSAFARFFEGTASLAMVDSMQRRYGGHDLLRDDPVRSTRAFSSDIVSRHDDSDVVTSSSSSAPGSSGSTWRSSSSSSSSSGSSGRGSSGGGGGGGGGSGW